MSKVSVVGTFTCQDGKADEMEVVLTAMVEAAAGEPGVEIYSYHRGDDNKFWFFALMADEDSMQLDELRSSRPFAQLRAALFMAKAPIEVAAPSTIDAASARSKAASSDVMSWNRPY